jgi:acyl-CoA synthetase (AMP-forming)/AMP-acid ligase II
LPRPQAQTWAVAFTPIGPRALVTASLALARSGLIKPYRPDRLLGIGQALLRYGAGPGCGPIAGSRLCPDRPAIVDDDGVLTFGQLQQRCEAVADGLARRLPPGHTVALLGRNSAGFYQAMVGAARCGLDVVYLNTGHSAGQIAEAVARRGVRSLVYDEEFAARVPPGVLGIPMTGEDALSIAVMAGGPPPGGLLPGGPISGGPQPGGPQPGGRRRIALAPRRQSRHILLTSGTTGEPKSAARTGGGVGSAAALLSGLPYRADETWLIAAPMFHGWGWLNLLLSMLFSSTVVVTRRFDPAATLALVERERCEVLVAVPTMLRRIMDLPPEERRRYDTASLRAVTVSGSALPPALAAAFMDEFGDILHSLYGSTEAGYAAVAGPADLRAAPGTAGRPLPAVDVRVLDDRGSRCPPGSPGMIWVRSRDALPAPPGDYTGVPGGGPGGGPVWPGGVRTGDIGWFDRAGRLFVGGRADDMIITGGENVYPAEVEGTIERHPSVLEAAVTGVPDQVYGEVLVAHLLMRDGHAAPPEDLTSWCRARLAPFQVPRRFVVHEDLPRNAAGKVVKRALREPG